MGKGNGSTAGPREPDGLVFPSDRGTELAFSHNQPFAHVALVSSGWRRWLYLTHDSWRDSSHDSWRSSAPCVLCSASCYRLSLLLLLIQLGFATVAPWLHVSRRVLDSG